MPNIAAQPPFDTQVVSTGDTCTIFFPKFDLFKAFSEFNFHFHVYNSTGHLMTNETTQCTFHLYNSSGSHILQNNDVPFNGNGIDFIQILNTSVGSGPGDYSYLVSCNQSGTSNDESCVVSNSARSTLTGEEDREQSIAWLPIILSLIAMTALLYVPTFIVREPSIEIYRGFFFLFAVVNTFVIGMMPFVILNNPNSSFPYYPVALSYIGINMLLIVAFIWFYGVHLFDRIWALMKDRRDKKKKDED